MADTVIEVLKWIGIVLAAGFVGYFGRYLAVLLIEKMRQKKAEPEALSQPAGEPPTSPHASLAEAQLKVEKKRAKAEAKKAKKEKKNQDST